jgi:hypothetical protein
MSVRFLVADESARLSQAVAEQLAQRSKHAIAQHGKFTVAFSGGCVALSLISIDYNICILYIRRIYSRYAMDP